MPKPLTMWATTNSGKFFMRWEYQTTWPASWEICIQVKKQQSIGHETMDWFQIGKGVWQGCILLLCLFNFYAEYIMQNARLDEAQAGIKTEEGNIKTSDMQMTPPLWQKAKGNERALWWKWKRSEKAGLKLNIQKTKIMASITSWQIDKETWKQWKTLFSWAPKSLQMVTAAMKLKDACSLEEKLWPT